MRAAGLLKPRHGVHEQNTPPVHKRPPYVHIPVVPPQHALQAEVAATTASGFAEHHLGKASRAFSTTNLTQNKCRLQVPMVVQRPPRGACTATERYCTKRRRWSSPSEELHPYSTPAMTLVPRGGRTYHRLCPAHQGAARALCCQRRGLRPHPSQEGACQPENGTMQAIPRAWRVAPSGRW